MFLSKHKQILKDKEAGLVFNWRNPLSLKYPLIFFLFLSLMGHFLFLHLFQLPSLEKKPSTQQTGTLFYLNQEGSPVTQKLLSLIQNRGALVPRGTPDVDPLAKGIDDQLSQPMTAGLLDWSPTPAPYPDLPFDGAGRTEMVWKRTLPPVDSPLLVPPVMNVPANQTASPILPHILSLSDELKSILSNQLPVWKGEDSFYGKYLEMMVIVSPEGKVDMVTPLNQSESDMPAIRQTERWIRAIPWKKSRKGGKGIITLEWREKR